MRFRTVYTAPSDGGAPSSSSNPGQPADALPASQTSPNAAQALGTQDTGTQDAGTQDTGTQDAGTQDASAAAAIITDWHIPEEHRPGLLRRIEEAGGIEAAAQDLWTAGYEAREGRRQAIEERDAANQQAEQLRQQLAAQADGTGQVVTPEQASSLEAYAALGQPEEVARRLQAAEQAQTQLLEYQRREIISQAAQAVGYDAEVLADRVGALEIAIDRTGDSPRVTVTDPAQETPEAVELTAYAERNWQRYLPILQQQARGSSYPATRPAGGQPAQGLVERFIEKQRQEAASRLNPLLENQES